MQHGKYFHEIFIFCNLLIVNLSIIAKYEKRGKYLPILHYPKCDKHFIVKYLLKSNAARVAFELAEHNLTLI